MRCKEVENGFNPRARVGRDGGGKERGNENRKVSIHAPAWGATPATYGEAARRGVSIHAPAWGATLTVSSMAYLQRSFNPRARVGRDEPATYGEAARRGVSIHAPA